MAIQMRLVSMVLMAYAFLTLARKAHVTSAVPQSEVARVAVGAAPSIGSDAPSLGQIKARLTQQRQKVQSLYLKTVEETYSPLSAEELRKLPGFGERSWIPRVESEFAFKGRKGYVRKREYEIPEPPPLVKPGPKATPMEKAEYEFQVENEKKRKALDGSNMSALRLVARDEMRGFNGRVLWSREISERRHPDGRLAKGQPTVQLYPPPRRSPGMMYVYPTEYLSHSALPVALPELGSQARELHQWFSRTLLPDLLEFGAYTAQDKTEKVHGTESVLLTGTFEFTVSLREVAEKHVTRERLWLDVERGLALRKKEWTTSPGRRVLYRVVNSSFVEAVPGVWLAQDTRSETIAPPDDPDYPAQYRGKAIHSTRTKLVKWLVNEVPDEVFEPMVKPGDLVSDWREKSPL